MLTRGESSKELPPKRTESLKAGVSLFAWGQGALVCWGLRTPCRCFCRPFQNSLRPPWCGGASLSQGLHLPLPPPRFHGGGASSSWELGKPNPVGDPLPNTHSRKRARPGGHIEV